MRGNTQIAAAVAACVVSSCASGAPAKISRVEVELYSLAVEVVEQDLSKVVLSFPWELENPKISRATVGAASWHLTIEGETEQRGEMVVNQAASPGGDYRRRPPARSAH